MITLNTYLAHAGICSRRKAVELIKSGAVTVNDTKVVDPGYRVAPADVVKVNNRVVWQEDKIYILLNKPNNYVTTVSDEKGRKTVLDLLTDAPTVRLYPVGRLDRSTTGLLLITNDGELAQRLSHPRYGIEKVYVVTITTPLKPTDLNTLKHGVTLPDGFVQVDDIQMIPATKNMVVQIMLHSGKNRVIRRLFEHLGYEVKKLDRIGYAGLTKKGLTVGTWRHLTAHEIQHLKKRTML